MHFLPENEDKQLVKGLKGMSYKERLKTLGSSSVEERRLRSDLTALNNFLRRESGEVQISSP